MRAALALVSAAPFYHCHMLMGPCRSIRSSIHDFKGHFPFVRWTGTGLRVALSRPNEPVLVALFGRARGCQDSSSAPHELHLGWGAWLAPIGVTSMTHVFPCLSLFSVLVLIASQERLRGLSSVEWQYVDVRWRAGADAGEQSAWVALFCVR